MLKRVSIQNFKSLKDVTLDLQKVNLLIGPNNSGKTNFLKALAKCDDLVRGGKINTEDFFCKQRSKDLSLRLVFDEKPYKEVEGNYTHIIFRYYDSIFNEKDYELRYGISDQVESETQHVEFPAMYNRMYDFFGISLIYKPDPNKLNKPGPVGRGG